MGVVERQPCLRNWYCDGCVRTTMHVWTGREWRCGTPGCTHAKTPVQKELDLENGTSTIEGERKGD